VLLRRKSIVRNLINTVIVRREIVIVTGALKTMAVLKASVQINAVLNHNTWTNNAAKASTHRDSVDRASDVAMATEGTVNVLGDNSADRASDMTKTIEDADSGIGGVDIITVAITVMAETMAGGKVEADDTLVCKVVVPIIAALGLGIAIN
jgi:hypothetical protein